MKKWWLIILLVVGLSAPATVEAATVDQQFEQQQTDEQESNVPTTASTIGNGVKVVLSLVVVVGGFIVLMRWLSSKTQGVKATQHMKHLGGVPLGKDRSVQLVKLGDQVYVLGVGDSIQLIDRLDADTMEEEQTESLSLRTSNSNAFLDTFKKQLAQLEEVRKKS
ncbi:MAG: flagellar biosynthetic protein FliO [Exiguobacterium sp.]|jgi:flagellar protein FliO/FliZ|uniref:Flagellar biosynthesis protein FliO n=1 Tax=Exiguobacterium sp. (strain ATCC BAA-1283 / AT1b) TaxID=360911 RepID=C4L636_EXISA|nr:MULTISPECIES: flagellar biosynthetic protein FliO [Exiguobacterium]MBR2076770.1 flagellar biosynthetic protein FliO [Exiguobacterium sp.]MCC9623622.1 flagellar biosynthetic protein FliO [Thalassospira sp. MA62]ACQ71842.1 flagellar biosynthesis protein FliO [Exiguobacterium sp. AT1b]MBR3061831.1 flagellar biosynthetic protein FliO [Exiguobacterium sp.]MBR3216898.1 flagellar biosynthetic protein FliO [Exiguobacterium sp.]